MAKKNVASKPSKKATPRASTEATESVTEATPGPTRDATADPVEEKIDDSHVRIRMYRHGLGDCFLISFRRSGEQGNPSYHILIDCGIIPGNPNGDKRIKAVVAHIKEVTEGKIDVLVATHEHADHVSGFVQAAELFGEKGKPGAFSFGQVWLAWTENPKDPVANQIRAERQQKVAALWMGIQAMKQKLNALGADERASADLDRASEVLSFFGIDASNAPDLSGGLGAAAGLLAGGSTAKAMRWVQDRGVTKAKFWSPGDVFPLEGVDHTRVFVLGPPKDLKQLHKDLPSASKSKSKETYEDKDDDGGDDSSTQSFGLGASGQSRAFLASAFGAVATDPTVPIDLENDRAIPFDRKYQIPWDQAGGLEFFQDHYFRSERELQGQDWRRIDGEWAAGSGAFAMQLDGDTNNTSLVLAFELPGGHVLLFPGDAQVGNWESWHADSADKPVRYPSTDAQGKAVEVSAESLLNRVIFYKVGHHGSHNATLRAQGLEMMIRPGLTAAIPVDSFVAHVKKRWKKMPFNPLMDRLADLTRTEGLVVTIDKPIPGGSKTVTGDDGVVVTVEDSTQLFDDDFDVENDSKTVKRPLYVDYRIKLP